VTIVRTAAVIDAPESAVIRALASGTTWRRTIRALGGRAEAPLAPLAPLRPGDVIGLRGLPGLGRRWEVRVDDHGLPVLRSTGRGAATVSLHTTGTGAGTLTRVDCELPGSAMVSVVFRQRVIDACQMLLGIATVTAREPLVVVAGALISGGTVLAGRKGGTGPGAGKWELPGGKVGFGETERSALAREMQEELGVAVDVAERIGSDVDLGEGSLLRAYRVHTHGTPTPGETLTPGQTLSPGETLTPVETLTPGETLTPIVHDQLRRLSAGGLDSVDWLPADRELLPALRTLLERRPPSQS